MRGKRNRKWVKEDEWDERGEKKVGEKNSRNQTRPSSGFKLETYANNGYMYKFAIR